MHTLYVANDNDFVRNLAGDNKFSVFGISDADLALVGASYQAQQFAPVPEPSSLLLMLGGLAAFATLKRRRA